MSDYNQGPGGPYDKYGMSGNTGYEPVDPGGRGPYILLGILVAIGLIGGLLYFNGTPRSDRTNQAQAPVERSLTAPAPATPMPAPATPAPSSTTTTTPVNPSDK